MRRAYLLLLALAWMVGCSSKPPEDDLTPEPSVASSGEYKPPAKAAEGKRSHRKKGDEGHVDTGPDPRLVNAKKSGNEDEMNAAVSDQLAKDPNDVVALNSLAMQHFRKGHTGMAKTILLRAYKGHEKSAALQNNLGLIYLADGDLATAIQYFKEALTLDSRLVSAAANLGAIHARYGDCDRALPLLELAYHYSEADVGIANNFGMCLGIKKETKRAHEVFDKLVSHEPRNPTVLYNYAILLIEYENNKADGASILGRLKFVGPTAAMSERVTQLEGQLASSAKH